jgi:hypothetical protein
MLAGVGGMTGIINQVLLLKQSIQRLQIKGYIGGNHLVY